jgi:predicted PurR-regulated permease PerM
MKAIIRTVKPGVFERIASLLWVVVIGLIITFCYFASSLCITLLLSAFISILVDPAVSFFEKFRIPRASSAGALVLSGMLLFGLLFYGASVKFSAFVESFPASAERVRGMVAPLSDKFAKVEESAGSLAPQPTKKIAEVKVKEPPAWPSYLIRGFGSASSAVLILAVVPFLTFYMLIRKRKWHQTMSGLLGSEADPTEFSNQLAAMVRRFAIGNLAVGAFMGILTTALLFALKVQGAAVLGIVSGFLNLVPFLGVILGAAVPLGAGVLQNLPIGTLLIIVLAVLLLHVVSSNFLIPRLVGSRMNIGPVAAIAGILFWGWLWGAVGVVLAIPLTGAVKLIADCRPSLGPLSRILSDGAEPAELILRRTKAGDVTKMPVSDAAD